MSVKSDVLHILKSREGESVSGEALAEQLGCSRAAVWKAVKALRQDGYEIRAVTNRGYCLSAGSSRLTEEGVRLALLQKDVLVRVLETTVSTNQDAKAEAEKGAPHGSVIISKAQSAGRGRRGRSFFSPTGGLYLSCILRPKINLKDGQFLTTAAAVAVYKAVQEVCGLELDIKWVNDLYREGRKICGILTEAGTDFETGEIRYAVVGIGVNLWIDPEELPEELSDIVGCITDSLEEAQMLDKSRLAASIVNHLLEEAASETLSDVYIEKNIIPGHVIEIRDGEKVRTAFAERIEPDGRLLVRETDGTESRLSFGEVSVRNAASVEERRSEEEQTVSYAVKRDTAEKDDHVGGRS